MAHTETLPPNGTSRTMYLLQAWWPAVLGMCVIAFESTEIFTAAHTSHWLRPLWQAIFGPVGDVRWGEIHHLIRKSGHFTGYGTLSLLFLRAWLRTLTQKASEALAQFRLRCAALAILCTFLTASADEFHQRFLPGRTSLFSDVMLDTLGGLIFHLLFIALFWRSRAQKG
ncbi:MAG: VanZ family protein [Acidobacteriaceae bacterium]